MESIWQSFPESLPDSVNGYISFVIIVSRKRMTKFYWMTIANMAMHLITSGMEIMQHILSSCKDMYGYIAWGLNNYIA